MVRRHVGAISGCDVACTLVISSDMVAGGCRRQWLCICVSGDVAGVVGGHVDAVTWQELLGMMLMR